MNENVTLARELRTDPTGTIVDMTAVVMNSAVIRAVPIEEATAVAAVHHLWTEAGTGTGIADIGEEMTTAVNHEIHIKIESARVDGEMAIATGQGGDIETKRIDTVADHRLTEGEDT